MNNHGIYEEKSMFKLIIILNKFVVDFLFIVCNGTEIIINEILKSSMWKMEKVGMWILRVEMNKIYYTKMGYKIAKRKVCINLSILQMLLLN